MKPLLIGLLVLLSLKASGQVLAKPYPKAFENRNSLQFELFGHGFLYSFNYERFLFNGRRFKTAVQAGFSYYPPSTGLRTFWIPVSLNQLLSFNQHHLELGLGQIFTNDYSLLGSPIDMLGSFRLGYRYQPPGGRFLFRAGFTPAIEYMGALKYENWKMFEIYPLGGLAVGYSF
jgi:hypothetical protein